MPFKFSGIGIYKLTNKVNEKIYIGQSINLKRRYLAYKNNNHHSKEIKEDIDKIGFNNFSFEILEHSIEKNLNRLEKLYIKKYNSNDFKIGYNKQNGGRGGGFHHPATIEKMRQAARNRPPRTQKTKDKMSKMFSGKGNPFYGRSHTKKTIEKNKKKKCKYGSENTSAKPIYCVSTGECFEYATLASNKYKLDLSSIIKCCKGKRNFVSGKTFNYLEC